MSTSRGGSLPGAEMRARAGNSLEERASELEREAAGLRARAGQQRGQSMEPGTKPETEKSTLLAYLCYFCGGLFGLHHYYLDRLPQAVMWTATGGCFGLGLLADFFYIPGYVMEANGQWLRGKRPWSFFAAVGYLWFAHYFTGATYFLGEHASWLVGTLAALPALMFGRKTLALPSKWTALGFAVMFLLLVSDKEPLDSTDSFLENLKFTVRCIIIFGCQGTRSDNAQPPRRSTLFRAGVFALTVLALVMCCCNYEIERDDGTKTTLASNINEGVKIVWEVGQRQFEEVKRIGLKETIARIIDMISGEEGRALRVLELRKGVTAKEIKKAWRVLNRKYHPDSGSEPDAEKLQQVNEAYETLNKIYKLRGGKSDDETEVKRDTDEGRGSGIHFKFGADPEESKKHNEGKPKRRKPARKRD